MNKGNQITESPSQASSRNWTALTIIFGGVLMVLVLLVSTSGQATMPAWNSSLLLMIPAAFLAGMLSFLSPCTLPLLPAYFAFSFQSSRSNVVVTTVAFFLGLATTLTLFGASATALSYFLFQNQRALIVVGGALIIVFGLMSFFGLGFTGVQFQSRPEATIIGSYVYGATFALGWSACIGPILGSILTLLATQGMGIVQGAFLAFIYAFGLGLPLILVATFFSRMGTGTRLWTFLRGRGWVVRLFEREVFLHSTSMISGALLIGMGVLLLSGNLTALTAAAAQLSSTWLVDVEESLTRLLGLQP